MALSSGIRGVPPKVRDPLVDYLKAVDDQIAERAVSGLAATPYLLQQKAELEARLGVNQVVECAVDPEPVVEPVLECAAADVLPENTSAVKRPGRPRKVLDGSGAADS